MTYDGDFDERDEGWEDMVREKGGHEEQALARAREGEQREDEQREDEALEDERLRALLLEVAPEFGTSSALGDRAVAGAARRRALTRGFGGVGAVAALAVGALAVAPLAGWGSHGSRSSDARIVAGAFVSSSSPTAPSSSSPTTPSPSSPTTPSSSAPSPSTSASHPTPPQPPLTDSQSSAPPVTDFENAPKEKAAERVANALQSGHANSYMGVGLSGVDYTNGTFKAACLYDASPILVYRKPGTDSTLERAAINAAAPFRVEFRDTVLDASEQWFLGHRLQQDREYWQGRGVTFETALQTNGTITIFADSPTTVVPLLEQYYGYDGRVFVGKGMPGSATGS